MSFDKPPAHLMCVHWSQESHEVALLRPVTPLPQWLHGCFGLYILFRSEGPGLGLTSPLFMSNKTIVVNGEML